MNERFWIDNKDYICHLSYLASDLIESIIDKIEDKDCTSAEDILSSVYEYINIYLYIGNMYYDDFRMKSIRDFFCLDYPEGEEDFRRCESILTPIEKSSFTDEELEKYFDFCEKSVLENIRKVLNDNPGDRHWSAVSVNGEIKSYIKIKKKFSKEYRISDIESYFYENGFSKLEYTEFEKLRIAESKYYIGLQL